MGRSGHRITTAHAAQGPQEICTGGLHLARFLTATGHGCGKMTKAKHMWIPAERARRARFFGGLFSTKYSRAHRNALQMMPANEAAGRCVLSVYKPRFFK